MYQRTISVTYIALLPRLLKNFFQKNFPQNASRGLLSIRAHVLMSDFFSAGVFPHFPSQQARTVWARICAGNGLAKNVVPATWGKPSVKISAL